MRRSLALDALVVLAWVLALAGALNVAPRLRAAAVTDPFEFFPADAPSRRAAAALRDLFPDARAASQVVLVVESADGAGAPRARAVEALAAELRTAFPAEQVPAVLSASDDPALADRLGSRDGRAALIVLRLVPGFASEAASEVVAEVERRVARADPGLRISLTGDATLGRDYLVSIEEGARRSAIVTVALVTLVLLAVHRSPVSAAVALASLGVALGTSLGIATLAAERGLPVAYQARGFLVALVYGIGTDYCLLLVARVRERTVAGDADPVGAARRRALPVLATSAAAVTAACAAMGFARFGLFRDTGPVLAIGAAVMLAAVLTFTPALMRLTGRALFWPARPSAAPAPSRMWSWIARTSVGHPVAVLAVLLPLLVPLVWSGWRVTPSFELELDIPKQSPSARGFEALLRHFEPASVSPLQLSVEADGEGSMRSSERLDALYRLTELLAEEPGVARVFSLTRPTGEPGRLGRATLASQLHELRKGLETATSGGTELAEGLESARAQVVAAQAELARKREELQAERRRPLVGRLLAGRLDAMQRDLDTSAQDLERLEAGLGEAARGAHQLADGVGRGAARLRALERDPGASQVLDHLALTPQDLRDAPGLGRALAHYLSPDGRGARLELELSAPPNAPEAVAVAARLQRELPPTLRAVGLDGAQAWLSGPTAITLDLSRLAPADLERLSVWIVAGVTLLLVLLLRELAAPIAIALFVLLSYWAALGALALLVEAGAWPALDWKTPFFVFTLLVAIGADYGVFLLGRAREEARALPYADALRRAVEATGPVISSCGFVLAGTFAALLVTRIAFLEQVGAGITVGVLIDTLIVRPFLLPAAAALSRRHAAA